jgi:hypothetical protein
VLSLTVLLLLLWVSGLFLQAVTWAVLGALLVVVLVAAFGALR